MSKFQIGDKVRFKSDEDAQWGMPRDGYAQWAADGRPSIVIKKFDVEFSPGKTFCMGGAPYYMDVLDHRLVKRRVRKVVTKQGIFSFVYKFLVKQGRPSANGSCYYRKEEDGKMLACAAGCLLTDEEAEGLDDFDNTSWLSIGPRNRPVRFKGFEDFIQALQGVHDDWSAKDEDLAWFKNEMASFAALHGLTVPDV